MRNTSEVHLNIASDRINQLLSPQVQVPFDAERKVSLTESDLFKAIDVFHHIHIVRAAIFAHADTYHEDWIRERRDWEEDRPDGFAGDDLTAREEHSKDPLGWGLDIIVRLKKLCPNWKAKARLENRYLYLTLQLRLCYIFDRLSALWAEVPDPTVRLSSSSLEDPSITTARREIRPCDHPDMIRVTQHLLPLESELLLLHEPEEEDPLRDVPFHARNLPESTMDKIALVRTQWDDIFLEIFPSRLRFRRPTRTRFEEMRAEMVQFKDVSDVIVKILEWTAQTRAEMAELEELYEEWQHVRAAEMRERNERNGKSRQASGDMLEEEHVTDILGDDRLGGVYAWRPVTQRAYDDDSREATPAEQEFEPATQISGSRPTASPGNSQRHLRTASTFRIEMTSRIEDDEHEARVTQLDTRRGRKRKIMSPSVSVSGDGTAASGEGKSSSSSKKRMARSTDSMIEPEAEQIRGSESSLQLSWVGSPRTGTFAESEPLFAPSESSRSSCTRSIRTTRNDVDMRFDDLEPPCRTMPKRDRRQSVRSKASLGNVLSSDWPPPSTSASETRDEHARSRAAAGSVLKASSPLASIRLPDATRRRIHAVSAVAPGAQTGRFSLGGQDASAIATTTSAPPPPFHHVASPNETQNPGVAVFANGTAQQWTYQQGSDAPIIAPKAFHPHASEDQWLHDPRISSHLERQKSGTASLLEGGLRFGVKKVWDRIVGDFYGRDGLVGVLSGVDLADAAHEEGRLHDLFDTDIFSRAMGVLAPVANSGFPFVDKEEESSCDGQLQKTSLLHVDLAISFPGMAGRPKRRTHPFVETGFGCLINIREKSPEDGIATYGNSPAQQHLRTIWQLVLAHRMWGCEYALAIRGATYRRYQILCHDGRMIVACDLGPNVSPDLPAETVASHFLGGGGENSRWHLTVRKRAQNASLFGGNQKLWRFFDAVGRDAVHAMNNAGRRNPKDSLPMMPNAKVQRTMNPVLDPAEIWNTFAVPELSDDPDLKRVCDAMLRGLEEVWIKPLREDHLLGDSSKTARPPAQPKEPGSRAASRSATVHNPEAKIGALNQCSRTMHRTGSQRDSRDSRASAIGRKQARHAQAAVARPI